MRDLSSRVRRFVRRTPWLYGPLRRLRRALPAQDADITPDLLDRHVAAAGAADPSFAGEAAHLLDLLDRCGIRDGLVVDIAAGDGVTQSCTLPLVRRAGWRSLGIELDDHRFRLLSYAWARFPGAATAQARVTPDTIVPLLLKHRVPERFEVLNLDLDSYDRDVLTALLTSFRPAIITMEINEKVPPPVHFSVVYDPAHVWREDHFFGCSLVAAAAAARPAGYVLEALEYNNAFFVHEDIAAGRIADRSIEAAYDVGYRNRHDRREIFPWNHDVEHLLRLPPEGVVRDLRRRFADYEGRFELTIGSPD